MTLFAYIAVACALFTLSSAASPESCASGLAGEACRIGDGAPQATKGSVLLQTRGKVKQTLVPEASQLQEDEEEAEAEAEGVDEDAPEGEDEAEDQALLEESSEDEQEPEDADEDEQEPENAADDEGEDAALLEEDSKTEDKEESEEVEEVDLPYIENFNKMKWGKSTWLQGVGGKCPLTTACRKKGCVKMIKDPKKKGKMVMEVKYTPSPAKYLSPGPGIRGLCAPTPIMARTTEFKGVMRASTSFRVFFKKGFEFTKAGKFGTGFRGGTEKAVGCAAKSDNGFSHRVVWKVGGVLQSYIYHAGRKNKCGDTKFANWKTRTGGEKATTANNFKFKTGRWYTVTQSMVLNDPPEAFNGVSAVYIDGNLMIQTTGLQWRGNPDKTKNLIDKMKFGTLYGGKDASFQPTVTTKALYDDIVVYPEASDDNVNSPLTYCMGGKKKGSKCCKKKGKCSAKASCASFWDTNCKIPKLPTKNF